MNEVLLRLESISKSFPGVKALDDVDIVIKLGEVHSILGENGAGKSTLMKIISGALSKDSGRIVFKDKEIAFKNTADAQKSGISMIYQEFNLAPHLTVEENIYIGNEPRYKFSNIIKKKEIHKGTIGLLKNLNIDLSPTRKVQALNICERQITEIVKALRNKSQLIIMDEPTSALSEVEIKKLYRYIDQLRNDGISILFISHNMEEVFHISDSITVLRDGRAVGTFLKGEITPKKAVQLMVGRDVENIYDRNKSEIGDNILEVNELSSPGKFSDISFKLHSGEVLGICGLLGAGKSEIVRAIFGVDENATGQILIEGMELKIGNVKEAINSGLGLIPEDRKNQGLFLERSVRQNMSAASIENISKKLFLSSQMENDLAQKYVDLLRIKTSSLTHNVNNLSGGNQQKVVIGKWLALSPRIMLMDDPTRGIDIGAKQSIYKLIAELTSTGVGVIFISSELPEVIGVADRVIVISDGKLKAEFSGEESTQEKIMIAATINQTEETEKEM